MNIIPVSFPQACAFVLEHHRHHVPPVGHKFSIGAQHDGRLVGVAMVGRPVARRLQDGYTLEVNRLCTDGTKNCCSMLYSAAWRACRAMGYTRLVTYILASENGTSLRASGWKEVGRTSARSWSVPSRPRSDENNLFEDKLRFEVRQERVKP